MYTYIKRGVLNIYSAPDFAICEVEVDEGFTGSNPFDIPGMGSKDDYIEY